MKRELKVFKILILYCLATQVLYGQCGIEGEAQIKDNETTELGLEVSGLKNEDLGVNNSLCRVNIEFTHSNIGDLEIFLISPQGEKIQLIGPVGAFGTTQSTNWDVGFVQCMDDAMPDLGYQKFWNNNQFWPSFGSFSGTYYPLQGGGCLEDFDEGPANGLWRIELVDNAQFDNGKLKKFELEFCDNTGLDCNQCIRYTANLNQTNFSVCAYSDKLLFDTLEIVYDSVVDINKYENKFIVLNSDTLVSISANIDLQGKSPGVYRICGITYHSTEESEVIEFIESKPYSEVEEELKSIHSPYCVSFSDCIAVTILENLDTINMSFTLCQDSIVEYKEITYQEYGTYYRTFPGEACDTVYKIEILQPIAKAVITGDSVISCNTPTAKLKSDNSTIPSNAQIEWSTRDGKFMGSPDGREINVTEAGIYVLSMRAEGCILTDTIKVVSMIDYPEFAPQDVTITCDNPVVRLESGLIGEYDTIEWYNQQGFLFSNVLRPSVQVPGKYKVIVMKAGGCIDSTEVQVSIDTVRPSINIQMDGVPCEGEAVTLISFYEEGMNIQWDGPINYSSTDSTIVVDEPGTYTLTVSHPSNGCESKDTMQLVFNRKPDVSLQAEELGCFVSRTQIHTSPDQSGYNYNWTGPGNFTSTAEDPFVFRKGTYYVTVTNQHGCASQDSIQVRLRNNVPQVMIQGLDSLGCQPITLSAICDSTQVTYFWSGPLNFTSNSESIQVDTKGEYIVEVRTPAGCVDRDKLVVHEKQSTRERSVFIEGDSLTCDNPQIPLRVDNAENDTIETYTWYYSNDSISDESTLIVDTVGVYRVRLKFQDDDCIYTISKQVKSYIDTPKVAITIPPITCIRDSSKVGVAVDEFESFTWSGPNGFTSGVLEPYVKDYGTYMLVITDQYGCSNSDVAILRSDTTAREIELSAPTLGCQREKVRITTNTEDPNSSFNWSGPNGYVSSEKNPEVESAGQYYVSVLGSNGCMTVDSITIKIDETKPSADIRGDTIDCMVKNVLLEGVPGGNYAAFQWIFPNGRIENKKDLNTSIPGQYKYVVIGKNSCTDTAKFTLIVDTMISPHTIEFNHINCEDQQSMVTALVENELSVSQYEWLGPNGFNINKSEFATTTPGKYSLEITYKNQCVISDEVNIEIDTIRPVIQLNEIYLINCENRVLELDPLLPPDVTLEWHLPNGSQSQEAKLIISERGNYSVKATKANQCNSSFDFEVKVDTVIPSLSYSVMDLTCRRSKTKINTSSARNSYTYDWSGPNGFSSTEASPVVQESGIYTVEVEDTNVCSVIYPMEVKIDTLPPVLQLEDTVIVCENHPITYTLKTRDIVEEYRWFGPNNFFSDSITPVLEMEGSYYLTAVGGNGCVTKDTIVVIYEEVPIVVNISVDKYDCYSDTTYIRIQPEGKYADFEIEFEDNSINKEREGTYIVSKPGGYKVTITNLLTGCVKDSVIMVERDTVGPIIELFQLDSFICQNDTIRVTAKDSELSNFTTFEWSAIQGEILKGDDTPTPTVKGPGLYEFELIDSRNNCKSTDTIDVKRGLDREPVFDIIKIEPACTNSVEGGIVVNNVRNGTMPYYFSFNGSNFSTSNSLYNIGVGDYKVRVKDRYGCQKDTFINLESTNEFEIILPEDTTIEFGTELQIVAEVKPSIEDVEVSWNTGNVFSCSSCLSITEYPQQSEYFGIVAINNEKCTSSDSIFVRVIAPNIYLPNAFSPNGDGVNDFVYPMSKNSILISSFRIYDRFGELLFRNENFKSNNPKAGWDGTYRGNTLNSQIVTYVLEYKYNIEGESKKSTKSMQLIGD